LLILTCVHEEKPTLLIISTPRIAELFVKGTEPERRRALFLLRMLLFRRGSAAAVAEAASRRLGAVGLDAVLLIAFAHAASVLTCSTRPHGGGRKEPSCGRAEEADGRSHARDGEEDHDGRGGEEEERGDHDEEHA